MLQVTLSKHVWWQHDQVPLKWTFLSNAAFLWPMNPILYPTLFGFKSLEPSPHYPPVDFYYLITKDSVVFCLQCFLVHILFDGMVRFIFLLNFWWIECRFQKLTCFLYLTNSLISCLPQFNPHNNPLCPNSCYWSGVDTCVLWVNYFISGWHRPVALKFAFALELHGGLVKS